MRGLGPQTPKWWEPTLTAPKLIAKFKRERRTPCGLGCFRTLEAVPDPNNFVSRVSLLVNRLSLYWALQSDDIVGSGDESDLDQRVIADIKTIWKADPDAIPCDVAVLGLDTFTCRQVGYIS